MWWLSLGRGRGRRQGCNCGREEVKKGVIGKEEAATKEKGEGVIVEENKQAMTVKEEGEGGCREEKGVVAKDEAIRFEGQH